MQQQPDLLQRHIRNRQLLVGRGRDGPRRRVAQPILVGRRPQERVGIEQIFQPGHQTEGFQASFARVGRVRSP